MTAEQLTDRKVGVSEIATILGLNPYQTAEELRLEKLDRLPRFEGNESTEAGEIMEPAIRALYAKRTGRVVHQVKRTITSEQHPWLSAHLDGEVKIERPRRGVEIKNVGWRMAPKWGEQGTDEIPDYYLPQPHGYLLVTGWDVWDVAAYFGGAELRLYEVVPDKEFAEMIVQATHDFWFKHVLEDVPCPVQWATVDSSRVLKRLYPGTNGQTVVLDESLLAQHETFEQSSAKAKEYEAAAKAAKAEILAAMGEAAIGALPNGVRWERRLQKRAGYSAAATEFIVAKAVKPKERKAA